MAANRARAQYSKHFQRNFVASDSTGQWNGCNMKLPSTLKLRSQLFISHFVTSRQSPFQPQFCLQHPSASWFTCELAWEDHCKTHFPWWMFVTVAHSITRWRFVGGFLAHVLSWGSGAGVEFEMARMRSARALLSECGFTGSLRWQSSVLT